MYKIGRKTALIVEDDMVCMFKVIVLLEQMGFKNFLKAADGDEAISIYEQANSNISLVIMDYMMPNMDGLEATDRLRKFETDNNLRSVPIIALTGSNEKEIEDLCLGAGMDYFLPKPINRASFETVMARIARDNNFQFADAG